MLDVPLKEKRCLANDADGLAPLWPGPRPLRSRPTEEPIDRYVNGIASPGIYAGGFVPVDSDDSSDLDNGLSIAFDLFGH